MKNVVAAFAVAPLGAALLVAAVSFLLVSVTGAGDVLGNVAGTAFITTAVVGYAAAVIMGIPGFLLFRRLRLVRSAHWVLLCAAVGAVAGAIVPVAIMLMGGKPEEFWAVVGVLVAAGAVIGAASGLLFARVIEVLPPAPEDIAAAFD